MGHRPSYVVIFALLALPALDGCEREKYEFETKSPANAGKAEIILSSDKTGNGVIKLQFKHLAPPARIDPAFAHYVVWVISDGNDPYKLGILQYDSDKRTGELEATYSDDWMKIIVTLEKDAAVSLPTGARVFEQTVMAPGH